MHDNADKVLIRYMRLSNMSCSNLSATSIMEKIDPKLVLTGETFLSLGYLVPDSLERPVCF